MIPTLGSLDKVFANFISIAISLAGIAVLVMLISGGIGYLMAGSDKEGAAKAQRTLTYAIGGLVLTVSAWIILNFIGNFLGLNFNTFSICLPGSSC